MTQSAIVERHCALYVGMEGFYHALQSWWAANLWENLKQAVSADQIKRFGEVNESDEKGQRLFSALPLEFAKGEHHVHS